MQCISSPFIKAALTEIKIKNIHTSKKRQQIPLIVVYFSKMHCQVTRGWRTSQRRFLLSHSDKYNARKLTVFWQRKKKVKFQCKYWRGMRKPGVTIIELNQISAFYIQTFNTLIITHYNLVRSRYKNVLISLYLHFTVLSLINCLYISLPYGCPQRELYILSQYFWLM